MKMQLYLNVLNFSHFGIISLSFLHFADVICFKWNFATKICFKNKTLPRAARSFGRFLGETKKFFMGKLGRTLRSVHKICNGIWKGSSCVINVYCILLRSSFAFSWFAFSQGVENLWEKRKSFACENIIRKVFSGEGNKSFHWSFMASNLHTKILDKDKNKIWQITEA